MRLIGENENKREGGSDVKFNTWKGVITFSFPFANCRSNARVIRVQV